MVRHGVLPVLMLLAYVGLIGCAPTYQTMGPDRMRPLLQDDSIFAADAFRLPLRSWQPDGPPHAVVLALHGFNDHSRSFTTLGEALSPQGYAVFAYDQRGFGQTVNRGLWSSDDAMVSDLVTAVALLGDHYPDVPLYVVGESMGGAVVLSAMDQPDLKRQLADAVTGVVLVAPAVWGRSTMSPVERSALWAAQRVAPQLTLRPPREIGIRPSDNIPMLIELGRDPYHLNASRVDSVSGLVDLMDRALAAAPKFDLPSLILYGDNEEVLPRGPVNALLAALPADAPQRIAVYGEGWHMLLRDLNGPVVLEDVATWLEDPSAPLPSGAERRRPVQVARKLVPAAIRRPLQHLAQKGLPLHHAFR